MVTGRLVKTRTLGRAGSSTATLATLDLAETPLEEPALGVIGNQRQRLRVALRCLRAGPEATQQVGAGGMEQVVTVDLAGGGQRIDERQRRPRTVHHGDRRRAVQGLDGRRLHAVEEVVEPDDLGPVGVFGSRGPTMNGGNRRLQRERTGTATQRLLDERQRLGDLLPIPEAAILILEEHEIARLVETGRAP